ncbi:hypothetical protein ONE63_006347 [Megalurothrips usitatus]|uniref:RING-type domain-containing protein n=1 Tax=Megalurothrips usitatus TaxID=439358 RepID=A0AAV7XY01_9NEOP|nr:hypothetical protein ONE63_006347 [Megalurothrips usitatus]
MEADDVGDALLCPLCIEKFDLDDRRPKLLDCGHTHCLSCLVRLAKASSRQCPRCRQVSVWREQRSRRPRAPE